MTKVECYSNRIHNGATILNRRWQALVLMSGGWCLVSRLPTPWNVQRPGTLQKRIMKVPEVNSEVSTGDSRQRKIIHCDCDCFYAAVEIRDDPRLRGLPVAVGGRSERRGVITTCSYEAREFGVRSAMPTATAKRLCPDLILIPPNMEKYRDVSQQVRKIFFDYTDLVEPLSLDEAFLDVSDASQCQGSATLIAEEIRRRVREEVGITVSAGVAPNKFLAKIGSDWNKPDGLWVITPDQVDAFVKALPVERLSGVGKVTARKLHSMGIQSCGDLREHSLIELAERFGRFGERLHELSYGRDNRQVKVSHRRKSLSVERTFEEDLADVEQCLQALSGLLLKLNDRLQKVDTSYVVTKQVIKLKFNDFTLTTMECGAKTVRLTTFQGLCRQAFERGNRPVRLIGLGVRFVDLMGNNNPYQLALFDEEDLPEAGD